MDKLGEFLGWVTGVGYAAAVLNFFVKRIYRRWISALAKDSSVRILYQKLMQILVRRHRWFGMAAAGAAVVHLLVQLFWAYPSATGIAAVCLLICTTMAGMLLLYAHKKNLLGVHRVIAFAGVAAVLLHLLLKL